MRTGEKKLSDFFHFNPLPHNLINAFVFQTVCNALFEIAQHRKTMELIFIPCFCRPISASSVKFLVWSLVRILLKEEFFFDW